MAVHTCVNAAFKLAYNLNTHTHTMQVQYVPVLWFALQLLIIVLSSLSTKSIIWLQIICLRRVKMFSLTSFFVSSCDFFLCVTEHDSLLS